MGERVLFVDDDANVLAAIRRGLSKSFALETAGGGVEALEKIDRRNPYAVIVADMRMPAMDGVELLRRVRKRTPETVRIMLTGDSDLGTATKAVNEGEIFRYLNKPCPLETLQQAVEAGVAQYRLVTAERELLENTLSGAIKLLTDVLGLVNPKAFGRATRVRRVARQLATAAGLKELWQIDLAASLSQVGCVTVPPETLEKSSRGMALTREERKMLAGHPKVAHDLLINIPRLDAVAELVLLQNRRYDGEDDPDGPAGEELPIGARVLKLALDLDDLLAAGRASRPALRELREREGWYDPELLEILPEAVGETLRLKELEVFVEQIRPGMILADDLVTTTGVLLVSRGQEVSESLSERLRNYVRMGTVVEPLKVLVPAT